MCMYAYCVSQLLVYVYVYVYVHMYVCVCSNLDVDDIHVAQFHPPLVE